MAGNNQAVLLMATLVFAAFSGICSATTFTVGDKTGWVIPSSASFYPNWASGKKFKVGDVLVFNFPAGAHTVAQVNKRNFDACNTANTIGAVETSSPANVTLTSAGTHNFICTIPTHCNNNQKLSVVVTSSSAPSPATSPTSSPTPSGGATTPATSPTAPSGGATSPSGSTTSPSGSPAIPAIEGPSSPSAPPPSFATSTSVGLLSLVSVAAAALMF